MECKVLNEPYGPRGGADLRFLRPSASHQFLHCETMDTDCRCIAQCACLCPSGKAGTKLYCLVTEAHVCEQLAYGRYPAVSWCGVEPAPLSYLRITSPSRYR